MKPIKLLDVTINYELNVFNVMNCLNATRYRFVKYLVYFFILSNYYILNAQYKEGDFKKIHIEIDGEEVFDVSEIVQDHQGYIWMITNLGLIRYNGYEGEKFSNKVNDVSIRKDGVQKIFVDYKGDIWIGTQTGLLKYNSDCDCIYPYPSGKDVPTLTGVLSIAEDQNKNIWIGTVKGELYQYEREGNTFSRFLFNPLDASTIIQGRITDLLADQNNNLWIGTNSPDQQKGSGLLQFNINSGEIKQFLNDPANSNSLSDNRISALYEDRQGQILIGTYKSGFHIYDSKNKSLKRIPIDTDNPNQISAPFAENKVFGNDPYVRLIHQDQNGGYWIGTTGKGVNYFNAGTEIFKNYNFNLVNPQLLWSIYEDRQGNIWLGGILGAGLFKTDPLARKYNLNNNFINVEAANESSFSPGILWIESLQQGLGKLDLKTNKITRYKHEENNIHSLGHNWVRSVYQENNKTLWLGLGIGNEEGIGAGDGGVDRMDIKTGTFKHFKLIRNDDKRNDFSYTVYVICEDNEGHLWLSTGQGGLFRSDKEKKEFKHFNLTKNPDKIGDVILNIVRIDSNGDIWASDFKDQGTLYLYDKTENTFNPYLKGFKVFNILIDKKGWYLISTWEKGLVHLNPIDGSYVQYTKEDGLPSNEGLDIVEGNDGDFWINTRIGPAKFDTETGEISSIGLLKGRYNTSILKASDGQLFLGANNGLVSFYPDQVIGNPYAPQIDINELLISDTNYLKGKSDTDELNLSYNQNDISFKYNALHFSDPEKNTYQYRLKPINDQWIDAGFERTARYFNLPPDSYTFEVKASNSDGIWTEKPEMVTFTIKQAWWKTWWAYVIYAAIIVFLADRFYRFQLSKKIADSESIRLKELSRLKNALYTNITHEFRTPLTVIKGMASTMKSNLEKKELDGLENSLELINRNSDGLLKLVNEMLDLAKIESGNMTLQLIQTDIIPFVKYLTQSFHSLAEEKGVSFSVYSELDHLEMDFDVNKFSAIVTNLLSNAIKFTSENGEVLVRIGRIHDNSTDYFVLEVKDSGLGIPKEDLLHIFDKFYQVDNTSSRLGDGTGIGLSLIKEFVELMNGAVGVESKPGKGSVFKVKIPITNNALLSDGSELMSTASVFKSDVASIASEEIQTSVEVDKNLPLVLIVEDNIDVAYYIKTCLKGKYQILHALNGLSGIEIAFEKIPDIIISDVMMPEKDGFEVCEQLKTDELTDHIPIIMLTAKATFEDRLTGLSYGADAYLTKPFEKDELLTRIDQLILLRKKMLTKFEKTGIDRLLNKYAKNKEAKLLQKIVKVIDEHITQTDFGPAQLALQLDLSESQLYRKLKAMSGKSTAIFIRSIRLQKGKDLIQTTDMTISEVAYDVGFKDPSWFSRAFKDEFGFAPSTLSR